MYFKRFDHKHCIISNDFQKLFGNIFFLGHPAVLVDEPRTRSMKSRTWSTISTPGRPFLEPDRFSSPIHRPGRGFRRPGRRISVPVDDFNSWSTNPRPLLGLVDEFSDRSTISTSGRPFLEPDRFSSPIHRPGRGFRRPGRTILGPGRRFQLLVDKSSTTSSLVDEFLGPGRRFHSLATIPYPIVFISAHSSSWSQHSRPRPGRRFSGPGRRSRNSWSTNPRTLLWDTSR